MNELLRSVDLPCLYNLIIIMLKTLQIISIQKGFKAISNTLIEPFNQKV